MGVKERRERDKENMRRLILDSAMELFVEEGYENVQIRKITDRIEYSPGTFYLYFKDKDEVFFKLHEEGFAELINRMKETITIEHPLERLQKIGEIYIDFALEKPQYYEIMFILRSPMKELKDNQWDCGFETFQFLLQTVEECIQKKCIKAQNAFVISKIMWSMVHGFVSLIIRDRLKMIPQDQLGNLIAGFKNEMRTFVLEKM